ncbi:hypothetical protein N9Z53_04595 [Mariniblastus sp.]|nr:hypothetical protein [Mariniblastus sp.]
MIATASRLVLNEPSIGKLNTAFVPHDVSVIRGNITVSQLSEFTADLSECDVLIKFPHETRTSTIASIRDWNASLHPDSFIFSGDYCYCATTAEKGPGHLHLLFERGTEQTRHQYLKLERGVGRQADCIQIISELQLLESRIEVGIDPHIYGEALTRIWHDAKRILKKQARDFPCFCNLLQICISLHLDTLNILRQGADLTGMSFAGIGFGIRGAAEAFAVSYALNKLVDVYNQGSAKHHARTTEQMWASAAFVLRDLEANISTH